MNAIERFEDIKLHFDPADIHPKFLAMGLEAATLTAEAMLPKTVPWPTGFEPVAAPLASPPNESDDLTRFDGYDAVIMTWTAAEASALAALMCPSFPTKTWYQYRHNVDAYIPLVTGHRAPFNDTSADMTRYFHSLGLYFPITIGKAKVLLFKSGLHMDYDGPHLPLQKLVGEMANAIQPKIFITTGTGGGIDSDTNLGDVVVAAFTRFFCTSQFAQQPFHDQSIPASPLPAGALGFITPALVNINASRLPAGSQSPKFWTTPESGIVTTDFFGFDDSTDHFKLQGKGRACDMGDAMVGMTLSGFPHINWYAIRNASDPQMPNPNNNIQAAATQAGKIYSRYGGITTAASVLASWSIVASSTQPR